MRFRSPFDDDVDAADVALLVACLVIIAGLVAWGAGLL